ncbi:RNA-binding protein 1 isoform X1 [Halyomorpha halys]|uniref:RNA-binding protein 1 isoform X1 n=1 Tax=Halyomorpha halys TaxID=286706 RepID=UPI000D0C80D8|nr:RNA-binding protein 1-like [Halyomorpha halys]XP_024218433.1 RNA-binding protein 1-like [Halyomorpha halys]XP_024218434.1 RNA-binding protein 1-like [Halyomorpha halys]
MSRYREWDPQCKVYVGNLGNNASKNELEDVFSKYGPLRNVWVARNPPGFAFIEFEDPRDAEDAVRGLDGTRCCGARIIVEMSNGKSRSRYNRRRSPARRSRSRSPWKKRGFSRSRSRSRSRSIPVRRSRSYSRERR